MTLDYNQRIADFLPTHQDLADFAGKPSTVQLLNAFNRLVTWFSFLYQFRSGQEQSVLIQSAHSKIIEIWILAPLGLIHSSYAALRTLVDICTSYTYYYSHPIEWTAVCEGRASWESHGRIVDWHLAYTPNFAQLHKSFGLKDLLHTDYQRLSSYVHSIPVAGLPTLTRIARPSISEDAFQSFVEMAESVDHNISLLFLGSNHRVLTSMSRQDLKVITKGISLSKLADSGIILPRVR